jgi:hypothetical protein
MPSNRTELRSKSRVLQKRYTHGEPAVPVVEGVTELARNAIALYPDVPATHFPSLIGELAEPELLAALDEILRAKYLIHLVRTLRRADTREPETGWLFPEIQEHAPNLPRRVALGKGKIIERAKLCYEHLEIRLKLLNKRHRQSKEVAALVALMDMWPPRTPKTQGLTLAELDTIKARRAGLI